MHEIGPVSEQLRPYWTFLHLPAFVPMHEAASSMHVAKNRVVVHERLACQTLMQEMTAHLLSQACNKHFI